MLPARADAYAAIAAAEGTVWALLLVLLPASSEFAVRFQLTLTVLVLPCGMLPYAPAGLPWLAFASPLGFAQLVHLMTRESQHQDLMLLAWGVTMVGVALLAQWLKTRARQRPVEAHRANQSARVHEHANVELNRSREQLRLALDAIDAGVADTNLISNERFVSSRYSQILGYADRDTCLREHRLSDASASGRTRARDCCAQAPHDEGVRRCGKSVACNASTAPTSGSRCAANRYVARDGRATRLVVSIVDDTERRLADQRLADSERRYRALVEASPSLIWICDRARTTEFRFRSCLPRGVRL